MTVLEADQKGLTWREIAVLLWGTESLEEWYQTVCHGCSEAFSRACAAAWPGYCIRCEGPAAAPDGRPSPTQAPAPAFR